MHYSRPHLGVVRSSWPLLAAATLVIDDAEAYAAQRARLAKEEAGSDPEATASQTVSALRPRSPEEYDPAPVACCEDHGVDEPAWKREQRTKHRSAFRRR